MKLSQKTWDDILHNVGDVADFIEDVASTLAPVSTLFGTNISAPIVLVSQVAGKLGELNDDVLEHNVFGLSATCVKIDKMIKRLQDDHIAPTVGDLEILRDNLNAIRNVSTKTCKLIS